MTTVTLIAAHSSGKTESKQRGASRREQHSVQFKARVIHDDEAGGLTQEEIVNKYRINQSLVSK